MAGNEMDCTGACTKCGQPVTSSVGCHHCPSEVVMSRHLGLVLARRDNKGKLFVLRELDVGNNVNFDAVLERDTLFGRTLIAAYGQSVIDLTQLEKIASIFNELRPDKPDCSHSSTLRVDACLCTHMGEERINNPECRIHNYARP